MLLGLVLVLTSVEQRLCRIMNPKAIAMKGKGNNLRESVPEREGVTKVVGPSGKRDPQNQSRRRPLPGYQLSGTERR